MYVYKSKERLRKLHQMKDRRSCVVFRAAVAAGMVAFGFDSAFADIAASEYVQRGLAVHFDGLNNAGIGQMDASSPTWVNLTGNGRDLTLNTAKVTLGADGGYTFNGVASSFTNTGYQALAHSTTELMMSLPSTYKPSNNKDVNFGVYSAYYGAWTFGFSATNSPLPGLLVGSNLVSYNGQQKNESTLYGTTQGVPMSTAVTPTTYVKTTQLMATRMSVDGQFLSLTTGSDNKKSGFSSTAIVNIGARNAATGTIYACRLYTRILTSDELAFNRALDSVRFKGVPLSEAAFPAGWRVGETNLRREVLVSLSSADGNGEVSVGSSTGTVASAWAVGNEGAVITATPVAGYSFAGWRGDTDGFDATQASVLIPADRPRTLVAHFAASGGSYAWTGGGDGRMWHDPANWGGNLPGPGASVTIGSGTVAIDAPTPHLAALTVGGGSSTAKLIVSNWNTKVHADAMTVANKGSIALSGGFNEVVMSNRIWLAGQTLTVASGGTVTANAGGYLALCGPSVNEQRRRNYTGMPYYFTAGKNLSDIGASYGGCQGYPGTVLQHSLSGWTYGSVEEPTDPGTGGGYSSGVSKGDNAYIGGGAIRMDFTGDVVINGTVSALPTVYTSMRWPHSGTGGSVLIYCRTIGGTGKILADAQSKDVQFTYSGSSSGGRIAIHYDVTAQEGVECSVLLSANGGLSGSSYTDRLSDPGTIWLPDAKLVKSPLVHCGQIVIPSLARLDFDSLDVSGRIWWPKDFVLNVAGDLNVVSSNVYVKGMRFDGGALNVGGNVRVAGATLRLGNGCDATIGGNLVQTNSTIKGDALASRIYFQAGPTNDTDRTTFGQTVRIGNTFSVASNSTAFFYSQPTNGAISKVVAKNVVLNQGAAFNANRAGYWPAKGPGAGNSVQSAGKMKSASHGGRGGAHSSAYLTKTYDNEKRPVEPGSGGGNINEGGGAIYVEATGTMTLNGAVRANATVAADTWQGSGSGGSVLIDAYKIRGETGTVQANGANSKQTNANTGRPGGGGRVAIWSCIDNLAAAVRNAVVAKAGTAPSAISGEVLPEDGTVYWGQKSKGLLLIVK